MRRECAEAFPLTWVLQLSRRACSVPVLQKQTTVGLLQNEVTQCPTRQRFGELPLGALAAMVRLCQAVLSSPMRSAGGEEPMQCGFSAHLHLHLAGNLATSGFRHHLHLAMSPSASGARGCPCRLCLGSPESCCFGGFHLCVGFGETQSSSPRGGSCVGCDAVNLAAAGDQPKTGPAARPHRWLVGLLQAKRVQRACPKPDTAPNHSGGSADPVGYHPCFAKNPPCK